MKINGIEIKSRNIPLMFVSTFIGGLMFFLPILALYFEKELFSVTNVAIVFAVEAIAVVIFEIPTGAIADLFGRRKSLILAYISTLLALVFLYVGGTIVMFILYAILSAFTRSLNSGTESALIFDTLQEENKTDLYKKIIGIHSALWPLGASIGSIIGGYLAKISLGLTVSATFVPMLIALALIIMIQEPTYEKEGHRNIFLHMKNAAKIVIHSRQLIIIVCAYFLMMALGETIHIMSPIFFEYKHLSIESFGWIAALTYGFSALGFYISDDIARKFGDKVTLVISAMLGPVFILASTLFTGIPLVALWTFRSIFFGIKNPIISHLLNLEVTSGKRATVLSINNFMGQLGVAAAMPVFGYVAELYTIQTAIQLSAGIFMMAPIILMFLRRMGKNVF